MCETSTHPESNLGVPSPANRRHEACRAEPAPSRLLHSPAQSQHRGRFPGAVAAGSAAEPRGSPGRSRGWQDPARRARMLLRHAAPSLPADGLTWMGRSSGRAARQLRLHRLSRPCRAQTRPSPSCRRRGPEPAVPGCRCTAAKAGSPSAARRTLPWDGTSQRPRTARIATRYCGKQSQRRREASQRRQTHHGPSGLRSMARLCRRVQGQDRSSSSTRTDTGGEQKAPEQGKQCHQHRDPRCPACCNKELIS